MRSSGIHLRENLRLVPMLIFCICSKEIMFLKLVPHLPVVMDLGLRSGCAQWYNQMFYSHWLPIFFIIQYIVYMAKGIFVHKVPITFYCCERWQIMLYTYAFSSIELSISVNNTDDSTEWIIVMRYKSCTITKTLKIMRNDFETHDEIVFNQFCFYRNGTFFEGVSCDGFYWYSPHNGRYEDMIY